MKVALAHDWLNHKAGGAERVIVALAKIFPEAPVYTLLHNPDVVKSIDSKRVLTSSLQGWPMFLRKRARYLVPFVPVKIEQWDFSEYDLVISSSGAWTKNILTGPQTVHISYCHSPMRFVWDYWPRYLEEQRVGPIRSFYIRQLASRLRVWDRVGVQRVDHFLANSKTTAERIQKYYGRESQIIYPPVDTSKFSPTKKKDDYLLIVGSLTPYKRVDLAIEACNHAKRRLLVVGSGPERARLKDLAGPTIEFRGFVPDEQLPELYAKAQALLYPHEEDFGITAVEAMASGTPVIAYRKGGATESVIEGETGTFFDEQSVDSLARAIERFNPLDYKQSDLISRAKDFDTTVFAERIKSLVESYVRE